mmetsp:Transcript_7817/g.18628  ORF Transcript_7817/g.18628 Transcript_7817/m.18628 type:complete len:200 (-) Transcript_7817:1986-2585(-)
MVLSCRSSWKPSFSSTDPRSSALPRSCFVLCSASSACTFFTRSRFSSSEALSWLSPSSASFASRSRTLNSSWRLPSRTSRFWPDNCLICAAIAAISSPFCRTSVSARSVIVSRCCTCCRSELSSAACDAWLSSSAALRPLRSDSRLASSSLIVSWFACARVRSSCTLLVSALATSTCSCSTMDSEAAVFLAALSSAAVA